MLEHLDKVNWSALRSGSGTVRDVPDAVRAYATAVMTPYTGNMYSTGLDDHGYREPLAAFVLPQGRICEASAHVIPFLLEILFSPETQNKAEPLHFLGDFAYAATDLLESGSTSGHGAIAKDPASGALQVIQELQKGMPAYHALLNESQEEETAYAAQMLLEQLGEASRVIG